MQAYPLKTVVLSSLEKVFPETDPRSEAALTRLSCLNNEPLSFQIAYRLEFGEILAATTFVRITSDLPVSLYSVGYAPVLQPSDPKLNDRYRAGLFPDRLLKKRVNPKVSVKRYPTHSIHVEDDPVHLFAQSDSWRAVWITLNEEGRRVSGGEHSVLVEFFSQTDGSKLGEASLTVSVIDASLPKQTLKYTNWFHCDCLCDAYGVSPFSPRFWDLFADYVKQASLHGMNMLLTPCFTPPLDTPIGEERMTVQLVGVTVTRGEYSFDFSLLERYLSIARKHGIEYFEHSHFFSQWGRSTRLR